MAHLQLKAIRKSNVCRRGSYGCESQLVVITEATTPVRQAATNQAPRVIQEL